MPGDGVLPLRDFMDAVRRPGFDGPYSLELFRDEYWAMDPLSVARRGIESMGRFGLTLMMGYAIIFNHCK